MGCKFIFAVISITCTSAFHHGFHAGLFILLYNVVLDWYSEARVQRDLDFEGFYNVAIIGPFILASFALGGIVGSMFIWAFSAYLGKRLGLIMNNIIAFFALLIQSMSYVLDSYELLIIGRFIIGISAGLASGMTPMYLVEISPYCIRGTVGAFYYVMVAGSMWLAQIFGLPNMLGDHDSWSIIFIICFIPTALQVVTLLCCPESPKDLFFDRQDEYEAEEALAWLRDNQDIQHEIEDIREEDAILKELGPMTWNRLFSKQIFRSPLIISVVILFGQQICGVEAMMYFSTYLFINLKYSFAQSMDLVIGLTVMNVLGSVVAMILMDKIGRRMLLMGSLGGMLFCSACIGLLILITTSDKASPRLVHGVSVLIYIYMFIYAIGVGTIPWFYAAELNNHFARPLAMSVALTVNWMVHFSIIMSFIPIYAVLGNFIFLIFSILDAVILVFATWTMRETMNMESVGIMELFYDD